MNQGQNVGIICILILRKEYVTIRKLYFYKLYSLSFIKDKFKKFYIKEETLEGDETKCFPLHVSKKYREGKK